MVMWKFQLLKHVKTSNVGGGIDPFTGEPINAEELYDVHGMIVPSGPEEINGGFQAGSYTGFFRASSFIHKPTPNIDKILDGETMYAVKTIKDIEDHKDLYVLELLR